MSVQAAEGQQPERAKSGQDTAKSDSDLKKGIKRKKNEPWQGAGCHFSSFSPLVTPTAHFPATAQRCQSPAPPKSLQLYPHSWRLWGLRTPRCGLGGCREGQGTTISQPQLGRDSLPFNVISEPAPGSGMMPQPCQTSPTQGTLIPAAPEMPSCPTAASRGMEEGLDTAHGPLQPPKSDGCPAYLPSQRLFSFFQDLISEIKCAMLHPALNLCW